MLFRKKKKQHIDYYLYEILIILLKKTEEVIIHEKKKVQKKDLCNIITEMLQDLPRQECFSKDEIVLQEKFEFQREIYAFLVDLGLKFPIKYKERKEKGVDLFFVYNNDTYIVQTRTTENAAKNISSDEIRDLAGVQHIRADKRIFITNAYFTKDAIETAQLANIYLIDSAMLRKMIIHKELLKIRIREESI